MVRYGNLVSIIIIIINIYCIDYVYILRTVQSIHIYTVHITEQNIDFVYVSYFQTLFLSKVRL